MIILGTIHFVCTCMTLCLIDHIYKSILLYTIHTLLLIMIDHAAGLYYTGVNESPSIEARRCHYLDAAYAK